MTLCWQVIYYIELIFVYIISCYRHGDDYYYKIGHVYGNKQQIRTHHTVLETNNRGENWKYTR